MAWRFATIVAAASLLALSHAAQAQPSATHKAPGSKPLLRPVAGGRMTSPFGWRIHPVLGDWRFHNGVDFALPKGSPVRAAQDGVVTQMGWHGNYGKLIRIRQNNGDMESVYAHLDSFAKSIRVGSRVKRGEKIATVGRSGLATGAHLYWEVSQGGQFVDPLALLQPAKISPQQESARPGHATARTAPASHQRHISSAKHHVAL